MLFNSDVFILLFLPLTLSGFYLLAKTLGRDWAIAWLVVASLFFYSWWNPVYVPLIIGSILVNYTLGYRLSIATAAGQRKLILVLGITFNLGLLGYFKYSNFFVDTLNSTLGLSLELAPVILPLAISFFTFQQIAYLADNFQGKAREYSLLHYFLFVCFFPQLIAGPIVHHKEMMPQFMKDAVGRLRHDDLAIGITIFIGGLIKKVVFADNISPYANSVFDAADSGEAIDFAEAWIGTLAYTLQIYFDFSGYSDMALGLGRMFGIRLPLNFNSPYKAVNIADFWRRWHMTLSRFLRDYLYIPLGGNRKGEVRRYTNLATVMLLGGLWHGAAWNFVIWGGLHGAYLMIHRMWRGLVGTRFDQSFTALWCARLLTFLCAAIAWVFFRATTYDGAIAILRSMFGLDGVVLPGWLATGTANGMKVSLFGIPATGGDMAGAAGALWIIVLLLIAFFLPNTQQIMRNAISGDGHHYDTDPVGGWLGRLTWRPDSRVAILYALLATFILTSLWQTTEFLYFQF